MSKNNLAKKEELPSFRLEDVVDKESCRPAKIIALHEFRKDNYWSQRFNKEGNLNFEYGCPGYECGCECVHTCNDDCWNCIN